MMKFPTFFQKHEKWIPLLLAFFFIILTASGLATMHNPDELVHRVSNALEGRWAFDETNFDYPSLPKYTMFGVGKIAYSLGYADDFKTIARFLSVLLGAGTIYLVYWTTRNLGGSVLTSAVASFFLLSNDVFSINSRFAHNDLYLTFFLTLTLYFLILYGKKMQRGWFYAAFFSVGLAASSKYNGGVFILLPLLLFLFGEGKKLFQEKLRSLEILFIGIILSFLGFALGTPKALLWMSFYFKRMLPALSHHASYGKTSESVVGIIGQGDVFRTALGTPIFLLFLAAFLYFFVVIAKHQRIFGAKESPPEKYKLISILLLAIIIFDLPIMASYNYQPRFFLPIISFFAILSALFIEEVHSLIGQSKYKKYNFLLPALVGLILFFSFLRVISVRLLLENDPRIAASEFVTTLPEGTNLEYTMYPPEIPLEHFASEYSYPIFFTKFEGQEVPEVGFGKPYKKFNEGEEGLLKRENDYFVIDSFTYARCEKEIVYKTNPLECDFFARLLSGKSTYYELIGDFNYSLPPYLPQIQIAFVNPEIQIFQRK